MTSLRIAVATLSLAGAVSTSLVAQKYSVPRTPWGDPDLQGADRKH